MNATATDAQLLRGFAEERSDAASATMEMTSPTSARSLLWLLSSMAGLLLHVAHPLLKRRKPLHFDV